MKKSSFLLFAFFLLQLNSFAQKEFFDQDPGPKLFNVQSTDASNLNLDSLMLDSVITVYRNSHLIPGLATLIVKDNQLIWSKNYGYRNLQNQLPVEDSTIFLIASVSKLIVATAVMQLWENGLIILENNINNYLPAGFFVKNPFYLNDSITVKMLMTHTSSLADNWDIQGPLLICGDSPIPLDSFFINYFTPGGLYYSSNNFYAYHPGQQYNYTNAGASLLALIVENLTGKSFPEYCRDSIFIPLSMNSTSWFLYGTDTTKIATQYLGSNPYCYSGSPLYPAAFLRTNTLELSNFLLAYLNNGANNNWRLLDSATINYMLSDQLGYITNSRIQGLIWHRHQAFDGKLWGHFGWGEGVESYMGYNPLEKYGIIWFQNSGNPSSNFMSAEILPLFARYAQLHGNIYAVRPSVNKTYARINIDTVLFRTEFTNLYDHNFSPHLIYTNQDQILTDSISLFDDGLHGDSFPNDGIYGGYIYPQQMEDFYYLGVSTIDNQTGKYFNTSDISMFTTAGPITIDSISYRKGLLNYHYVRPFVHNWGTVKTITNASLRIICNDPWIEALGSGNAAMPNIPPNSSVGSSSLITISVIDSIFPGYFNFKVEVKSDGITYWSDSIKVNVLTEVIEEVVIPTAFQLEQNFPNPFNPTTRIQYQVASNSLVTLKVYDVLGNEVATLVNEEKPAGSYDVEFKSAVGSFQLVSGIYFYKLQAGLFVDTKKMILLR